ncbi:MAG: NAD(+)/NADH kinase [Clostridiales bacterium]|jgi:NAD+ kinase|nr:NAD(+)/NADH kinase [Clostridiales bacterium]
MRKIGVFSNLSRDPDLEFTDGIVRWLYKNGHEPLISEDVGSALGLNEFVKGAEEIYERAELLVVLGGDGTILSAARNCAESGTPLLGVNIGALGYLTDVDASDAIVALERALSGDYVMERRMMLEARAIRDNESHLALNDVCVFRGGFSTMLTINLDINGEYIGHYRADGLIVATPTGSTAYNLSAGGPILKPDSEMIAITPICAHMLCAKAFVVSADDVITINVERTRNFNATAAFDGQNYVELQPEDIITVRRSSYHTKIIKTVKKSFYSILSHKMNYR